MLIGEVSRHSGISTRMLRHYDSIGLVPPTGRTAGGYREYSDADLERLFHAESLRSLGLSLVDVRRALDDPDFTPTGLVETLITSTRERIARAEELLQRLQQVHASAPTRWSDALRIVSLLRGLHSEDPSRRLATALSTAEGDTAGLAGTLAEAVLGESDPNVAGALRWALERSGDEALDVLAQALASPEEQVRQRAVIMIAELTTDRANAVLAEALEHHDAAVRRRAALVLGARGNLDAVPMLTDMVVTGHNDVEASETLGSLAHRHDVADDLASLLTEEIGGRLGDPGARIRLTQALAELPPAGAQRILDALSRDADADVARTATYIAKRFGEAHPRR